MECYRPLNLQPDNMKIQTPNCFVSNSIIVPCLEYNKSKKLLIDWLHFVVLQCSWKFGTPMNTPLIICKCYTLIHCNANNYGKRTSKVNPHTINHTKMNANTISNFKSGMLVLPITPNMLLQDHYIGSPHCSRKSLTPFLCLAVLLFSKADFFL